MLNKLKKQYNNVYNNVYNNLEKDTITLDDLSDSNNNTISSTITESTIIANPNNIKNL